MSLTGTAGFDFIVIGASVAGLAATIALKTSGHNVLVLEKEQQLGGINLMPSGLARVPPNGCKILFDWGLGSKVVEKAVIGEGFVVYKYDSSQSTGRDCIGFNRWDPEFLTDARGDFMLFHHQDLLQILYDAAVAPRPAQQEFTKGSSATGTVKIIFGGEVIAVNSDACSVVLRSGDIYKGDIIIGADGARGIVRQTLVCEELDDPTTVVDELDVATGLSVYSTIIPKVIGATDPELASLYAYPRSRLETVSMGSDRGALTCLVGTNDDMAFWVYAPDSLQDGTWTKESEIKMTEILGPCDMLLQKLAALAGSTACIQIKDHYELDSWVSASGRVVVLGEAAHPFPPASLHTYSIALEDGVFMGKIFSHTRSRDRIAEFLSAFHDHRRKRCSPIRDVEKQQIALITLPDGEKQAERDALMRENQAAGRNVMDSPQSDLHKMLEEIRWVFGYEPTDDAEDWWMSWGRFRDAAAASCKE